MKKIDEYGKCPECNFDFKGEKIFDSFKRQQKEGSEFLKNKTDKEIKQYIEEYYNEPYCWSRLIGIEDSEKYDGVSYWMCPGCGSTWDRWTGEKIK